MRRSGPIPPPGPGGGYTPFPNALLDGAMPRLSDTAWRVLCTVVRATLGWSRGAGNGRKRLDWLTQRQLMRRTGRASAALSRAVHELVREGLVVVRDESGQALPTAAARRRHRGKLYYGLSDALWKAGTPPDLSGSAGRAPIKREVHKAKSTKENPIKRRGTDGSLRVQAGWTRTGDVLRKRSEREP